MRSWTGDGPARGFSVTLEIVLRCNVRCVFCSRWSDPTNLAMETIREIAEDMASLGAGYVSLTGGDPFVRSDIQEIIDVFATAGVPIHINTNGVLLKKNAEFLRSRAAAFTGITVSIDSPVASVHDEIRGVEGTFERALEGMESIRDAIPVSLACTLNQKNLHEIESYNEFARELGYDFRFQPLHDDGDNQLSPNQEGVEVETAALDGLGARLEAILLPTDGFAKRQYYRAFEPFFRDREAMNSLRCTTAARTIYFIDPKGEVFPCDTRRDIALGNVYESRLSAIVDGEKSTEWRATCRKGENGCWCMYACVAPDNLRWQDLPILPLTKEGWPIRQRWRSRLKELTSGSPKVTVPPTVRPAATSESDWPKVGIVVASFNGGDFLMKSMTSLFELDYPNDRRQVVLVDDASDDESIDAVCLRFSDRLSSGELKLVTNETCRGVPGAYNAGVVAADGDVRYFLKVDNDLLPEPSALKKLVGLAEANPNAGIVGGRIYFHTDRTRIQFLGGHLNSPRRGPALIETPADLLIEPEKAEPRYLDVINSCMALVRREVFERAGLFPEFYGRYEYEDYDFAFHARELGYHSLYCPSAVGYHAVSLTSTRNDLGALRVYQRARNGVIFMSRFSPRSWLVTYLAYHVAKVPIEPMLHGHSPFTLLRGYVDGLRAVWHQQFAYRHLTPQSIQTSVPSAESTPAV